MHYETVPTTERYEFDQALWSDLVPDQPVRSDVDWIRLYQRLGQLAIKTSISPVDQPATGRPYLRGNDHLSADDIRELEEYFAFLRCHYGIPEGATVFPKRPAAPAEPDGPQNDAGQEDARSEDDHAA